MIMSKKHRFGTTCKHMDITGRHEPVTFLITLNVTILCNHTSLILHGVMGETKTQNKTKGKQQD